MDDLRKGPDGWCTESVRIRKYQSGNGCIPLTKAERRLKITFIYEIPAAQHAGRSHTIREEIPDFFCVRLPPSFHYTFEEVLFNLIIVQSIQ